MTDPRSTARDSATSARSKTFRPPAGDGSALIPSIYLDDLERYLAAELVHRPAQPILPPETRGARIRRLLIVDLRRPVVAVVDALAHLAGLPCSSRCPEDDW